MISIRVDGGLGNQLFMIFAVLAHGFEHNVKPIFEYYQQTTNRHTYWETFLDGFKSYTTANPENGLTNEDISQYPIYQEPDFAYNELPDFGESNTRLNGFFQSYKYFETHSNRILDIMNIEQKIRRIQTTYPSYFDGDKTLISLHFRMGDYKHQRWYHPIMNYEYFESALTYIMENKPEMNSVRVLVFCEREDNEYVYSKMRLLNEKYPEAEFVKVDDAIIDYEQLMIMSMCNHNVIANSSYSWWGAYLNKYAGKIVCFPSKWFADNTYDHMGMMCDSWVKITSEPIHWSNPLI